MNRFITGFLAIILVVTTTFARDYAPKEVPNVQVTDARQFVSDPDGLLSGETKARVNARLAALRDSTTAEVVVVMVSSIGDYEPMEFAHAILNNWGVGKKDKNNGAVLLIARDQRKAFLATGYGLEGPMPDITTQRILQRAVVPAMKENNPDKAVEDATALIASVLTDPVVAEEIRSSQRAVNPFDSKEMQEKREQIVALIWNIAFAMLVFAIAFFFITLWRIRKYDNQQRAFAWKQTLTILIIASVFSLGMAIPVALLAWWMMKRARNRPIKCPNCGAKMVKLNEEEDNAQLTPSQDFEEKLNSVDYDVWVCPDCNTVERFAYRVPKSKYTECPKCHTVAMAPVSDKTLVPATTRREGVGEHVSRCHYCGYEEHKRYRIPVKEDAALAAAAILGAAAAAGRHRGGGGGGGFGGGFGGGGFGGGMSGGGGSGASW